MPLDIFKPYINTGQLEPIFPFHSQCYVLLNHALQEEHDIQSIDKDILYSVMFELSSEKNSLCLEVDYGIAIADKYWEASEQDFIAAMPLLSPSSVDGVALTEIWGDVPVLEDIDYSKYGQSQTGAPGPFSKLPDEILIQIAQCLDTSSLFQLLESSPTIFSTVNRNQQFWKRHIKTWIRWFFDFDTILSHHHPPHEDADLADLMRVAFLLENLPKCDSPGRMALVNQRRIWQVCNQIFEKYMPRREAKQEAFAGIMRDPVAKSIYSSTKCDQLVLVDHLAPGSRRDLRDVLWIRSPIALYSPLQFEAYFDREYVLVGMSLAPAGQCRPLGRTAVKLPPEDGHVEKVEIVAERIITGLVIHTIGEPLASYAVRLNEEDECKTEVRPKVSICGITVLFTDDEEAVLGDQGEGKSELVCHRPLMLPEGETIQNARFLYGLLGETVGEVGQEKFVRLGLLQAPSPDAVQWPSDTITDMEAFTALRVDPLESHLWKESSARLEDRWIWEWKDCFYLDTVPLSMQLAMHSNEIHDDLVPKEQIIWATDSSDFEQIRRLTGWLRDSGEPAHLNRPPKHELCGLRVEYHGSTESRTIGITGAVNGKSWPERELIHFDIDGPGGERVTDIGVHFCLPQPPALLLRTNRDREVIFTKPHQTPDEREISQGIITTSGTDVAGIVLGFGKPGGWIQEEEEYPMLRLQAKHTGLTYIGALSMDF
ncbi:hypothetical protein EsH8_III_000238 [Colletotrichum jinshuiense]